MTEPVAGRDQTRPHVQRAAVFVDYESLYHWLDENLHHRHDPAVFITDLLEELRHYLRELNDTQTAVVNAYADFGVLCDNDRAVQNDLYLIGAEPRFVPSRLQPNATEIQLCVDACDVLHTRPDIRTFVVVTGDRPYLPLVKQFKRFGYHAFVAAFEAPEPADDHPEADFFLDARNLLSEDLQAELPGTGHGQPAARRSPVTHHPLDDDLTLTTLAIIEEHFGQYDEVYLTPLLRKLSEELGPDADPKELISDLEEANAVWLEKRRGTPYDYTVLIVDDEHPDVQNVRDDLLTPDLPFEASEEPYDEYDDDPLSSSNGDQPTAADPFVSEYDFTRTSASGGPGQD